MTAKEGSKIIFAQTAVISLLITTLPDGYPEYVKKHCLHLSVEGNGFRPRERLTGVCHNTVINWVKAAGLSLSQQPEYGEIPAVAQIEPVADICR